MNVFMYNYVSPDYVFYKQCIWCMLQTWMIENSDRVMCPLSISSEIVECYEGKAITAFPSTSFWDSDLFFLLIY